MTKLAFLGAGKMVTAIVKSLLQSNAFVSSELVCCSAKDGTSEALSKETGIARADSIQKMLSLKPDILVLGCKPQQFGEIRSQVPKETEHLTILSIMAGITLAKIEKVFPRARNFVRSMPNTPGQIGEGVTGYFFAHKPSPSDQFLVKKLLSSLGDAHEVNRESDLDLVTAISGSGPAYLFEFACCIEEAGKKLGLDHELAEKLSHGTIIGAAKLMETSDSHPEKLRNEVTSPNGTTQAALESFGKSQLRKIVGDAVKAAAKRSIELSNA